MSFSLYFSGSLNPGLVGCGRSVQMVVGRLGWSVPKRQPTSIPTNNRLVRYRSVIDLIIVEYAEMKFM